MHQLNTVVIDLKESDVKGAHPNGWTIHITRENNSSALVFGLHWKDMTEPTYFGVHNLDDFNKAMAPLLVPQVST